jgi:sulfide dehydrogenase cytochrome subunit
MKRLTRLRGASLLISIPFLAAGTAAAADDPLVNQLLASQCAQCHGTFGHARGDFDSLAGEEAADLVEDLADMKGEDRPEDIMEHQALGYTDEQIRRIAAYYAAMPEPDDREEDEDESGGGDDTDLDDRSDELEREEGRLVGGDSLDDDDDEDDEHEDDEEDEEDEEDEHDK